MSAFIVSETCMNRVVTAALFHSNSPSFCGIPIPEYPEPDCKEGSTIGKVLYALNRAAVRSRYPDKREFATVPKRYRYGRADDPKAALLKAIHCLIYQCSEGNVPKRDEYRELAWLASNLAESIVRDMPEYRSADWD
jgi:hypothetical protein